MKQDLERKQSLAKKLDRNSNDEDRVPPSLEDLKRRGISFSHNLIILVHRIHQPISKLRLLNFYNQIVSGKKK